MLKGHAINQNSCNQNSWHFDKGERMDKAEKKTEMTKNMDPY